MTCELNAEEVEHIMVANTMKTYELMNAVEVLGSRYYV